MVKNSPVGAGDKGLIPGSGRSSGEEKGNPLQWVSSFLPGKLQPAGLQSMGSQRVGHNLATEQPTNCGFQPV